MIMNDKNIYAEIIELFAMHGKSITSSAEDIGEYLAIDDPDADDTPASVLNELEAQLITTIAASRDLRRKYGLAEDARLKNIQAKYNVHY